MSIAFVRVDDDTTHTNNTGYTVSADPATADGNLLLAAQGTSKGSQITLTPPAQFTDIADEAAGGNSSDTYAHSGYRIASGDAGASWTWTFSPSCAGVAVIVEYSGVDTTTPIDTASPSTGHDISTVPGITTTVDGCLLVIVLVLAAANTLSAVPAGWTKRFDVATSGGTGTDPRLIILDAPQATAGATGDIALTVSSAVNDTAIMFALRPASASPSGQVAASGSVTFTAAASKGASGPLALTASTSEAFATSKRTAGVALAVHGSDVVALRGFKTGVHPLTTTANLTGAVADKTSTSNLFNVGVDAAPYLGSGESFSAPFTATGAAAASFTGAKHAKGVLPLAIAAGLAAVSRKLTSSRFDATANDRVALAGKRASERPFNTGASTALTQTGRRTARGLFTVASTDATNASTSNAAFSGALNTRSSTDAAFTTQRTSAGPLRLLAGTGTIAVAKRATTAALRLLTTGQLRATAEHETSGPLGVTFTATPATSTARTSGAAFHTTTPANLATATARLLTAGLRIAWQGLVGLFTDYTPPTTSTFELGAPVDRYSIGAPTPRYGVNGTPTDRYLIDAP